MRVYTDEPGTLDQAVAFVTGDPACDFQRLAARLGVSIEVIAMPPNAGIYGAFWPFLAASDQQADPILIRDCDSRLNPPESAAVAEWLEHGHEFHVMHDHPDHADWPMLAGMWGVRGDVLTDMERRIEDWGAWNKKADDQRFLAERIWPEARCDLVHHSSIMTRWPSIPFPQHRPWAGFVGEIVPIGP